MIPHSTIAFIGGGNMATSLIGGLISNGMSPDDVWVSDALEEKLALLQERFAVRTTTDNTVAVSRGDTVVLAVKPQHMREAAQGLAAAAAARRPLFVSVAAGVRQGDIARWLDYDAAIVRTMPNTPALVGAGATALFANGVVSAEERSRAESILRAVGITLWVDSEDALDAVTAVSGSGPAYYFLLMELMEEAGHALGLTREAARMLTLQTAYGAARMALESDDAPSVLRARVTSPAGTTERAIHALREGGLDALVTRAIGAARERSIELGEELGKALMGGPYVGNAATFLIETLFGLYILVVMLRFLLQIVRADFYNPVSQFIVSATQPLLRPLRRVIPGAAGIDLSSLTLMVALQCAELWLVHGIFCAGAVNLIGIALLSVAMLLRTAVNVFVFSILIQVVISWVNPGLYNPVTSILSSLIEPLLGPARRLIPPISGLDLSPIAVIVGLQLASMLLVAPLLDAGAQAASTPPCPAWR